MPPSTNARFRQKMIVVNRVATRSNASGIPAAISGGTKIMAKASAVCEPEWMDAEDPLFILYTSGSTGKPKGVLHTTARISALHRLYPQDDLRLSRMRTFTGARPTSAGSQATATSFTVRSCNGATSIMFEGVPNYPESDRFWEVVEKYKVNIFYTAPTAIRAITKEGEEWLEQEKSPQPETPRQRGRAHQPRSLDVVLQGHRKRRMPDHRHLVADGDRRHPDHAAARRHSHQTRYGHPALHGRLAGPRQR